jgi:ABC-2 type transport system ATP-binding protein
MIEAIDLAKYFGTFPAVTQVTLDAREGEIVVLLGPNGAGKTTTIRMFSAILRPSRGRAIVAGYDVEQDPIQVRHRVGLLTELPGLYDRMRALDYLDFFGAIQGLSKQRRQSQSESLLRRFELWEARHLRLGDYSKGMRQKVSLVRALLHNAPVLLLDEPTSAMDPASARLVRESILEFKRTGHTLLICTHNLAEAELLADRIAIIRLGQIVAFDTPANLRRQLLGPPLMEVQLNHPLDGIFPQLKEKLQIAEQGPTWFRYSAPQPKELNPQVIQILSDLGASMVTLSEVPRSLEEIYLRIIGAGDEALSEAKALIQRRSSDPEWKLNEPIPLQDLAQQDLPIREEGGPQ